MKGLRQVGGLSLLLLVLLGAAGCAGSDEGDPERNQIAKTTFIRKASEICGESKERLVRSAVAALRKGAQKGETRYELEDRLVRILLIPTLKREIAEIRELGAPAGDRAEIEAFLSAIEDAVREAEAEPETYIQAGGDYRLGRVHYGEASKLARAYGLQGCPQG